MKKLLLLPAHILTGLFLFAVAFGSPFVFMYAIVYFTSNKETAFAVCRLMGLIVVATLAGQYFYGIGKGFWEDERG